MNTLTHMHACTHTHTTYSMVVSVATLSVLGRK